MTESVTILTPSTVARLTNYADVDSKLANIRISIIQASFGEDGIAYPAQDVSIYGEGLAKLRDLLNTLPAN